MKNPTKNANESTNAAQKNSWRRASRRVMNLVALGICVASMALSISAVSGLWNRILLVAPDVFVMVLLMRNFNR